MNDDSAQSGRQGKKPARIAQACVRCRTKKIRCDGVRPCCTPCAALPDPCDYAEVQRRRGPGRSKKHMQELEDRLAKMESVLHRTGLTEDIISLGQPSTAANAVSSSIDDVDSNHASLGQAFVDFEAGSLSNAQYGTAAFVPFTPGLDQPVDITNTTVDLALHGQTPAAPTAIFQKANQRLEQLISSTDSGSFHEQKFSTMPSPSEAVQFLEPIFDDINTPYKLLDWDTFSRQLLQPDSQDGPAGRACTNAVMGTGFRFRSTNSSFAEMSRLAWGYFKNAFAILPQLLVQGDALPAMEAILAMAIYLKGTPDTRTTVLLVSCATRLYQSMILPTIGQGQSRESLPEVSSRLERVTWAAYILDVELSLSNGISPALCNFDPVRWQSSRSPTTAAQRDSLLQHRCQLAMIESKTHKALYSFESVCELNWDILDTISTLEDDLSLWKLSLPSEIHNMLDDPAAAGEISLRSGALGLAFHHCTGMITWAGRRHVSWSAAGPLADKYRKAARQTIRLFNRLPLLPISDLCILEAPTSPESPQDLMCIQHSWGFLERMVIGYYYDLSKLANAWKTTRDIAREAIQAAKEAATNRETFVLSDQSCLLLKHLTGSTHPTYIAQDLMGNLRNNNHDAAKSFIEAIGVPWDSKQTFPPLVPESLVPETYGFTFA
ncbi:hypothetical protein BX600DRAFT_437121 [Xylariales sp. PMI_506]|nr:hypothetical protein BX600DRAFT_437121 [Xylariales sp. PMI_506]